jgi:hypothetical protein
MPHVTPLLSAGTLPPPNMQLRGVQTCRGQHVEGPNFPGWSQVRHQRQPGNVVKMWKIGLCRQLTAASVCLIPADRDALHI